MNPLVIINFFTEKFQVQLTLEKETKMCRSCYLSKVSSKSGPKGNKIFVLYIDQDDVKKGCGFRSRFLSSRTLFYVISKEALARRVHQQHDLNNNKRNIKKKWAYAHFDDG